MGRQDLELTLGQSLGARGEPVIPLLEQIRALGVQVTRRQSISNVRRRKYSGERTLDRLESSIALVKGNASRKDAYYWDIAATGLGLLNVDTYEIAEAAPKSASRRRIPSSEGFTQTLAYDFEIHPAAIGRCIRAMRADFVMAQSDPSYKGHGDLVPEAIETIDGFLKKVAGQKRADLSPGFKTIDADWDRKQLEDFYKALYSLPGREIGSWTPVEFSLLERFYSMQSTIYHNIFTPFDRMILTARQTGQPVVEIIQEVADKTGVAIDKGVIEVHRNLILLGKLVRNPLGVRR